RWRDDVAGVPAPASPTRLTPATLEDLATTWRNHEDRIFLIEGRVEAQAPLTDLERIALGWPDPGVGARFDMKVGLTRGAFPVSVYAARPELASAFQVKLATRERFTANAVVVVVESSADHPTAPDGGPVRPNPTHFALHWEGFR